MNASPLGIGDRVKVTAGTFEKFVGEIVDLTGETANVRFVILGRDCGTIPIPIAWLRRAKPNEMPGAP